MGDGNDADSVGLQSVDQGIREVMERQHPSFSGTRFAELGETGQHAQRLFDLADKILCGDECAFAYVPIDSGVGVDLSLAAKTNREQLWRH